MQVRNTSAYPQVKKSSRRDLDELAHVWVQFDPSFMEINQGNTERDAAFLKRKRVIFRQEEAILAQVEKKSEKLR